MTCGGVLVSFDGNTKDDFISPDNLVGVVSKEDGLGGLRYNAAITNTTLRGCDMDNSAPADDWPLHGEDTSELQNLGLLGSNAMYNPNNIRLGVEQGFDEDSDFGWYIRGKLCFSDGLAKLLAGERVSFSKKDYRPVSKYLEFSSTKRCYIDGLGPDQIDKLKSFARLGEENEAKEPHTIRSCARAARLPSLRLRPLQPIEVLGHGEAIVLCPPGQNGLVKIRHGDTERFENVGIIRPLGFKQDPVDVEQFFLEQTDGLPKQSESYRKEPSYLLDSWRTANKEKAVKYHDDFNKLVGERGKIRRYACGVIAEPSCGSVDKPILSIEAARRLRQRTDELHARLLADYDRPLEELMMLPDDFKPRIVEIKNTSPFANVLLLCGGIAPELTVYKRLGVPLGKIILQDTDLHAVGVAVAAHPDIEFLIACHNNHKPGDIRILTKENSVRRLEIAIGGIHDVHITNPCQTFSLAGKKEGFDVEGGRLFWDAIVILRELKESSEMPIFFAENVYGTHENNEHFNNYLGYNFFEACGSMCSSQSRKRRFATNQPPAICASRGPIRSPDEPPSLDGDLPEYCAEAVLDEDPGRIVPRKLKKFRCLMHSKPTEFKDIWTQEDPYQAPERAQMTAEEAERSMGYSKSEVGITAFSAEKAVRKRIAEHDVSKDSLVSLKGCADDKNMLEEVSEKRRLQLLGNSEVVTLLEAIMWNSRQLFPPSVPTL
jgi:site-specific DNA-cytosine methylase